MAASRQKISSRVAVAVSLGFYAVSLGLPALEFAGHEPVRGFEALCWGWWGFLTGNFPWLANPFYFAALVLAVTGNRSISQIFCGCAVGTGLLSLGVREWWFNEGSATPVERLGSAFYFWMGSFLVLFSLLFFVKKQDGAAGLSDVENASRKAID